MIGANVQVGHAGVPAGVAQPGYADSAALAAALEEQVIEFWDADAAAHIALANTDKVTGWTGEKASGIVPFQATDANRPIYNDTQWGDGLPSLQFGATSRRLNTPDIAALPDGAATFEVWLVVNQQSLAGTQRLIQFPNAVNDTAFSISHFRSGVQDRLICTVGNGTSSVALIGSTKFLGKHVVRARVEPDTIRVGMDANCRRNVMASASHTAGGLPSTGNISFGAGTTGGANWTGQMRKVLITSLLADADAENVLAYLQNSLKVAG